MTALDPSHLPFLAHTNNRRTGAATHSSIAPIHELSEKTKHKGKGKDHSDGEESAGEEDDEELDSDPENVAPSGPSWRGAWARRQAAHKAKREEREDDERQRGRIPGPPIPIPDLRYEQGILLSVRPFLHRIDMQGESAATEDNVDEAKEAQRMEKQEAQEKGALVSEALTAEGVRQGEHSDLFSGPLRIEWAPLSWVIIRDQMIFPCLQGALWGVAGLWLTNLWDWNKARRAQVPQSKGSAATNLLARLGVRTR